MREHCGWRWFDAARIAARSAPKARATAPTGISTFAATGNSSAAILGRWSATTLLRRFRYERSNCPTPQLFPEIQLPAYGVLGNSRRVEKTALLISGEAPKLWDYEPYGKDTIDSGYGLARRSSTACLRAQTGRLEAAADSRRAGGQQGSRQPVDEA